MGETDAELVARVRRGDRAAGGRLLERYLRACRAVALAIIGDEADAEDICQDAFVAAVEHIDDCRKPERFGAWLMRIVRNRARNYARDRSARGAIPLAPGLPSKEASPARAAERGELRERLIDALMDLPEVRREVLLLHDLEGWTHREIAERLELPQGTVRSHLHYARKQLRRKLGDAVEKGN